MKVQRIISAIKTPYNNAKAINQATRKMLNSNSISSVNHFNGKRINAVIGFDNSGKMVESFAIKGDTQISKTINRNPENPLYSKVIKMYHNLKDGLVSTQKTQKYYDQDFIKNYEEKGIKAVVEKRARIEA